MNKVVEILMRRDGMSRKEAEERVAEVREKILEASPWEAECIMEWELGLEMDYIFDLI